MNNRTGHLFLFIVVVKKSKVFESRSESFVIKIKRKVNILKDFFVTFQKLFTIPNSPFSTRAIGGTRQNIIVMAMNEILNQNCSKYIKLDKLSLTKCDWLESAENEMRFIEFQHGLISALYLFEKYIIDLETIEKER